MIFTDLPAGDAVFVDANTLIYHFTNWTGASVGPTRPTSCR
jgi:hypothetical protein